LLPPSAGHRGPEHPILTVWRLPRGLAPARAVPHADGSCRRSSRRLRLWSEGYSAVPGGRISFRVCSAEHRSGRLLVATSCTAVQGQIGESAGQRGSAPARESAPAQKRPSRIRTCAHGSGDRCLTARLCGQVKIIGRAYGAQLWPGLSLLVENQQVPGSQVGGMSAVDG
jgi:hypothetical protein